MVGLFCELDALSTTSVYGYFIFCFVEQKKGKRVMEYLGKLSVQGKFGLALANQWSKKRWKNTRWDTLKHKDISNI